MNEIRTLWKLAWPVIVGQVGLVGMGVVDLIVAGALDGPALAAVGLGHTWSFATLIFGLGVASGIDPEVTQAYGADRPRDVGRAALHGGVLLGIVSIAIMALHLVAGPALTAFGQPADAVPMAAAYCGVLVPGVIPFLGFAMVRQVLQGGGVMRPATWVILAANGVNLIADLVLVLGLGWGVEGLALATVVVRWFMWVALMLLGRDVLARVWVWEAVSVVRLRRMARMALPVGWQLGFEVWAFNAASLMAGLLGSASTAAHTAALSAASLAFMVPMGLSAAVTTRVGNQVGARQPWRRSGWTAIGMGAVVMTLSGVVFTFLPEQVARVYTRDPAEVALVVTILPIAALFGVFDGVQVVSMGVLRGLGDTRTAAFIALFAYWCVGLPVGWSLLHWGLTGVWTGLSVGLGTSAVTCVAWLAFRSQR